MNRHFTRVLGILEQAVPLELTQQQRQCKDACRHVTWFKEAHAWRSITTVTFWTRRS